MLGEKIQLFKNFRSRAKILDFVNYIFKNIMSTSVGEMDYNETEFLNKGADFEDKEDCNIELNYINLAEESDEEDVFQDEVLENPQLEAKLISKKIKELFNNNFMVYDKTVGGYRKIQYKDIVVLLRNTKNISDVILEELTKENIPVYSDTGTNYFEGIEINTMLSLLKIIDNPMQDIPLVSVLRSPIATFTDNELVEIRLQDKQNSFYEAMQKRTVLNDELAHKIETFISRLNAWKEKMEYMKLNEFIWYLYKDTNYEYFVNGMIDGKNRLANLTFLLKKAEEYEKASVKGLFNFVLYLENVRLSGKDTSDAKILSENEDVVRIMSIHKSKGLEFPVVFLSGLGKKINVQDLSQKILIHKEIGIGIDVIDYNRGITYPSLTKYAIARKTKLELLSEEMRLLYVALTRAKEKLILTSTIQNYEKAEEKWTLSKENEKLSIYPISKAIRILDWINAVVFSENLTNLVNINVYNTKDLLTIESKKVKEEKKTGLLEELTKRAKNVKSEELQHIEERFNKSYEHVVATTIPSKVSVTEIKNLFNKNEEDDVPEYTTSLKRPKFLEDKIKLTSSEKGSVIHYIVSQIDLRNINTFDDLKKQVEKLILFNKISKTQLEQINLNTIYNFTKSDLASRIRKSEKVYKEVPFTMSIKSQDLYNGVTPKDKTVVQGIIDCYFEEEGNLILVDYKTDYIEKGRENDIIEKYKTQLGYYKKALEEATLKKVAKSYIYSFYLNQEIQV